MTRTSRSGVPGTSVAPFLRGIGGKRPLAGSLYYYLAANLGLVIRDHVTLAMENLPRLMQLAVDLSPEIDGGGSVRLLRILYLEAPPWPTGFGDGEKALGL